MAGFTDLAFRVLCRRNGAGLVCTEMVAASSVERKVANTLVRMRTVEEERPVSIQVFGDDPEAVARATRDVERGCDIVGFNMGCPAHQIRRQGCGAALLDRPELAADLVRAVRSATGKPILVKVRAGNGASIDVARFARGLVDAGASGILFHARTAKQGYSGRADWTLVGRLKDALGVPVIGNGDVVDGASAERLLRESGADGVAVGRAALGDPRVFSRIAAHLGGAGAARDSPQDRVADFIEYLRLAEGSGVSRQHVAVQAQQFTRGMPGAAALRTAIGAKVELADVVARFEAAAQGETGVRA